MEMQIDSAQLGVAWQVVPMEKPHTEFSGSQE